MTDQEFKSIVLEETGEPLRIGPGWLPLAKNLYNALLKAGWDGRFTCVKEKYGHLRFYLLHKTQELDSIVKTYMRLSALTCEKCGGEGRTRTLGGWDITVCAKHFVEWTYPRQIELVNYRGLGACQICGFFSVLDGECRCCYFPQWQPGQFNVFDSAEEHAKVYQEDWYSFVKELPDESLSPLPKSSQHKIYCSEEEINTYTHFTEYDFE